MFEFCSVTHLGTYYRTSPLPLRVVCNVFSSFILSTVLISSPDHHVWITMFEFHCVICWGTYSDTSNPSPLPIPLPLWVVCMCSHLLSCSSEYCCNILLSPPCLNFIVWYAGAPTIAPLTLLPLFLLWVVCMCSHLLSCSSGYCCNVLLSPPCLNFIVWYVGAPTVTPLTLLPFPYPSHCGWFVCVLTFYPVLLSTVVIFSWAHHVWISLCDMLGHLLSHL